MASSFHRNVKRVGARLSKVDKGACDELFFVGKLRHQHSSGRLIFHKNVIGEASVREGQKCFLPIVVCEKCEASKVF